MAFINLKDKLIQAKIVYYGPGKCGKKQIWNIFITSVENR